MNIRRIQKARQQLDMRLVRHVFLRSQIDTLNTCGKIRIVQQFKLFKIRNDANGSKHVMTK